MAKVNIEYFEKWIDELDETQLCEHLNEKLVKIREAIQEQIDSITDKLAFKEVLSLLLEPPSSIEEVLSYLSKVKDLFIKMYAPYLELAEEYAELVQKYAELLAKVTEKISNLQCNITTPALPDLPDTSELPDPFGA